MPGTCLEDYLKKARTLIPPEDWYNLACLESISENVDIAFEHLRKAVQKERLTGIGQGKTPISNGYGAIHASWKSLVYRLNNKNSEVLETSDLIFAQIQGVLT
jgi:hypothetical protein